jgi:MFS family permease
MASTVTPAVTIRTAPDEGTTGFLLTARALRDFGDGFVAVLLPAYLTALGFTALEVGIIATAALLGSALLTLAIGVIGSRYDHRRLLIAAAGLMVATGAAFTLVHDYAVLVVIALAGTVNPSAGSVSVFVPLEHAVLAGSVNDRTRTSMFARYSLIGALAGAFGALAAAIPDLLTPIGMSQLAAIKAMFVLYALLGLLGGLIYARLPARPRPPGDAHAGLGPSRGIVYKLAALFSLDAFAGGFVVQSLLALWLFERFELSLASAGAFFFWSGVLSAFSFPVAAWLSRRIGLVNTMVYTHIPSSLRPVILAPRSSNARWRSDAGAKPAWPWLPSAAADRQLESDLRDHGNPPWQLRFTSNRNRSSRVICRDHFHNWHLCPVTGSGLARQRTV